MLSQRLVAHRGYRQLYPENSLLAINGAIDAGARCIELDVLFSADGVPVLYHDSNMQRISDMAANVQELAADKLLQAPAFEPARLGNRYRDQRIAPLSALPPIIAQRPELRFFVEAKPGGIAFMGVDKALAALHRVLAPVLRQIVLISFDKVFITSARSQGWPGLGLVLQSWRDLQHPVMGAAGPDYIFVSQRHLPERGPIEVANANLVVYEIAAPELAIHWFRRGADLVETFDIGGMLNELARRAL